MPRSAIVPPPSPIATPVDIEDHHTLQALKTISRQLNASAQFARSVRTPLESPAPAGPVNVATNTLGGGNLVGALVRLTFNSDRSGPNIVAYRIYRSVGLATSGPDAATCIASIAAINDDNDIVYQFQDQDVDSSAFAPTVSIDYWVRSFDDRGIASPYIKSTGLFATGPMGQFFLQSEVDDLYRKIENYVVLGGDVTNNNAVANTIQDVTGLSFPVVNGETYWFQFVIPYTSAATTTGSRWSINGPTTSLLAYHSEYTLTATTQTVNYASAYDTPAASNASSLTAGNVAIIEGVIKVTATSSVIARFASEVAGSAIVAKAGAFVKYRKIA